VTIDFPSAASTSVSQVNDEGTMVGGYQEGANDPFTGHGFVPRDGEFTSFDPPGAIASFLNGINDAEQMAGTYGDETSAIHAFLEQIDGIYATVVDDGDG
jgi:hypothetical protein